MASRRSFLPAFFLLLLGLPPIAAADMWRCALPDGSEIYTNTPESYSDCKSYEPKSELLPFITSRYSNARESRFMLDIPSEPSPPSTSTRAEEARPYREMPFEVFRMLGFGMTEAEVLHRAGPPSYVVPNTTGAFGLLAPISSAARYYYLGDWIVTVSFDLSGRVINLDRSRPSP
jgi:hypothetical protein